MNNIDLFDSNNIRVMPSLTERVEKAIATLLGLFEQGISLVVAFSGGKDSATVAALTLMAARQAVAKGLAPHVVATTSDTLVENPEVHLHYRAELHKMERFGQQHGFSITTQVVTPPLASTFQVKTLTGRGLPSFVGQNADCSISLKCDPQSSWRNRFFKAMKEQGAPQPVTLLGTRYDESEQRALRMAGRGETDRTPVSNKDGDLVLSPICYWLEDDVWEFIGEAAAGTFGPCYSDFEETRRIYAHSSATSCAVVADALAKGKARGGCGARHGCWVCQQATDKSLENMLEFDPRYEYMRGLNRLNKFIRATRWDWNRRHWVGRTIKGGYIAIEPDTYHPTMIRELARYMLQLDHDERVRSRRYGHAPRFTILPENMLLCLDALWSLNGLAKPFAIWKDWQEIRSGKVRYDIPDVPTVLQTPQPPTKFLYVGKEWDDTAPLQQWTGLRDPMIEGLAGECLPDFRELDNGNVVWDVNHEQNFEVHWESVHMLMDFEMDRILEMADESRIIGGITAGYKFYTLYGALQLSHSQVAKHDEILRRTAFKDRMGLTLDYDIHVLRAKAADFRDLPAEARQLWSRKATTDTAQTEMLLAA